MQMMLTECDIDYLHVYIQLFNSIKLMLKWCKIIEGWMRGNFEIYCRGGQMLLLACDRMIHTVLSRKLFR